MCCRTLLDPDAREVLKPTLLELCRRSFKQLLDKEKAAQAKQVRPGERGEQHINQFKRFSSRIRTCLACFYGGVAVCRCERSRIEICRIYLHGKQGCCRGYGTKCEVRKCGFHRRWIWGGGAGWYFTRCDPLSYCLFNGLFDDEDFFLAQPLFDGDEDDDNDDD